MSQLHFDLAKEQIARDRELTSRLPELYQRKKNRLLLSPHAFLRGSAPLFYDILRRIPDLAEGPGGEGWLVGDMHLENVGAYRSQRGRSPEAEPARTDASEHDESTVFALNDFDDAAIGPWRLDVLRLATSVLLAGRTFRATGAEAIRLCDRMVASWCKAAWGHGPAPSIPDPVAELVRASSERSAKKLLDDRAPADKSGTRAFVRGDRYTALPKDFEPQKKDILKAYIQALGERAPKGADRWEVADAAWRIAGTGSLGVLRFALLVKTKDDMRIFDLKESRPSACAEFVGGEQPPMKHDAERVVAAACALNLDPPRLMAAVQTTGLSLVARKLFPQEDKLALDAFHTGPKLESIVEYIGYVLGSSHARGVTQRPPTPWSDADRAKIVDSAITLAGMFEAIYLGYARVA